MSQFKARKEELDKKETHFKNSVLKFNNFLTVSYLICGFLEEITFKFTIDIHTKSCF